MKIYPDLQKIWAKRIRDAGMTSNQAKKVLEEAKKSTDEAEHFIKNPQNGASKRVVQDLLKKINIF